MFSRNKLLTIYYEDLVKNPESEFKKVTDLLDLHYNEPQTKLRKQNPEKLSDLIINYDELKTAFLGSKWERLFEDQSEQ